jgi:hypothetical protein
MVPPTAVRVRLTEDVVHLGILLPSKKECNYKIRDELHSFLNGESTVHILA